MKPNLLVVPDREKFILHFYYELLYRKNICQTLQS